MKVVIMKQVTDNAITLALQQENPWWTDAGWRTLYTTTRNFFPAFYADVELYDFHRAIVLMGPRRTGKTVLMEQAVSKLLESGVPHTRILFASLDNPIHFGCWLEEFLKFVPEPVYHHQAASPINGFGPYSHFIFFDEVQHFSDWQRHLKVLVDSYPNVKFIVSGSAAAALRQQSMESGAGRFQDFLLPPLTFAEYLNFIDFQDGHYIAILDAEPYELKDISQDMGNLNEEFLNYINFGGFPEQALAYAKGVDKSRLVVGKEVLDKVLLLDLPSIYGIDDTRELYRFFAMIALNTGMELSVKELAQSTNISENTIKKYLKFLEAAFLIQVVQRIDHNGKHFKRAWTFKVYITNPSLRTALYGPVTFEAADFGQIAETAVFSQLYRPTKGYTLSYARWKTGEVDLLWHHTPHPAPIRHAIEIKWSNRVLNSRDPIGNLAYFQKRNKPDAAFLLTKSVAGSMADHTIQVMPVSCYCLMMSIAEDISDRLDRLKVKDLTKLKDPR